MEIISFDSLLISNMNELIKNKLNYKDYEYIKALLNSDLYYYARHINNGNDNPFIKYLFDSNKNDWNKIRDILNEANNYILNGDENKKLCLQKLENLIIENKNTKKKKIVIDMSYATDEELRLFQKYNALVIFVYIPINTLLKTIKIRNIESLKKREPKEYRHIIFVLDSYLNYFKKASGKLIDEIDKNKYDNIITEIPLIDPYYLGYHKKKFTNIDIIKNINIPFKCYLPYVKYFDYENKDLVLLNEKY